MFTFVDLHLIFVLEFIGSFMKKYYKWFVKGIREDLNVSYEPKKVGHCASDRYL